MKIECKAKINAALKSKNSKETEVDWRESGDANVICSKTKGLICYNKFQAKGKFCKDYSVRFFCQCEPIQPTMMTETKIPTGITYFTITEECGWTPWLNIDKPRLYKTDDGDVESIEILQKYYGVCQKPYLKYIECRIALTKHDYNESLQNNLICNIENGFKCYNRYQAGDCYDYEIRVYCQFDWCPKPTVPYTSTVALSSIPTRPCPPGQVYDQCAYNCEYTCQSYLFSLQISEKCIDEVCVAGCRPEIDCKYPSVWRDADTCVTLSLCTCILPNGKIISPGDVEEYDCEKCQCYNNTISCVKIPGCGEVTQTAPSHIVTEKVPICIDPMGMENGQITLDQIFVSSTQYPLDDNIRLHSIATEETAGGWIAAFSNHEQYIQVDFYSPRNLTGIITQGENGLENWVSEYTVQYSNDGEIWNDIIKYGKTVIFSGNSDSDTPVTNYFPYIVQTRYIRIKPHKWHNWITMRIEILGCFIYSPITEFTEIVLGLSTQRPSVKECVEPMGFENHQLPTSYITVSSSRDLYSDANRIRLRTVGGRHGSGGWVAGHNDDNQFVEIDFKEERKLTGIITQGQEDEDNWVTHYSVMHSNDKIIWNTTKDEKTNKEVFMGNTDRNTSVIRWFSKLITARYLRIVPLVSHGAIAMRLEVIGCFIPYVVPIVISTPPPLELCPELPETLEIGCPIVCPAGYKCNGQDCIDPFNCPCFHDGKKFKMGDILETEDCQECQCLLGGYSQCEPIHCPSCPEGLKQEMTKQCKCKCNECPEGTILCPTNNYCLEEFLWCNGANDCPDDEKDCAIPFTVIEIITTPKLCIPNAEEAAAVCELNAFDMTTFDDAEYVYDICDHVLFREKTHQLYSVQIHKECTEINENCGRYIVVNVDDFSIKFGSGQTVEFRGNNIPLNKLWLMSKRFKQFSVTPEGQTLKFISLKYGFQVIWDNHDNVKIKISDCLKDQVNGLCGFYNNIKEDDFQRPDNTLAVDIQDFGNSWRIGHETRCIETFCSLEEQAKAKTICDHYSDTIFDECKKVVNIEKQKNICTATSCECLAAKNSSLSSCLCQSMERLIQLCEEKLASITDSWRITYNCVPKCPPGLEWRDCGPSCELTCDNFQEKNNICASKCSPGCFCPPGLLKQDNICIPAEKCHDCVCQGHGDPNYITFDGHYYAFQGNCTYVLARHRSPDHIKDFEIHATNIECPEEPGTSCTAGLTIYYKNNLIEIFIGKPVIFNEYELKFDDYPFYVDGVNITATSKENTLVYIYDINLVVRFFELNYGFTIELPSKLYYNSTEGLCGVCNFEESDDLYHRDGYVEKDIDRFAYSWLVDNTREKCTLTTKVIPNPNPTICEFKENACGIFIDPISYIKACENDVTYSRNQTASVCRSKLQYAQWCCEEGVAIDAWLAASGCVIQCPGNMEYKCINPCQLTCTNYKSSDTFCEMPPQYTCSCPEGLVLKDGECVDPIYCEICDEYHHRVGDRWDVDECQSCECYADLTVVCSSATCADPPICKSDETLKIATNTSCCNNYVCISSRFQCPEISPLKCKPGEVAKVNSSGECPVYFCECDVKLCDPVKYPTELEDGEEIYIEDSACCKKISKRCRTELCLPPIDCPKGTKLEIIPTTCCPLFKCSFAEKCIYKHEFKVVDGFEVPLTSDEEYIEEYDVGQVWKDGLCRSCKCEEKSGQYIYYCEMEKCLGPIDFIDSKDYIYEKKENPGSCCPKYQRQYCLIGQNRIEVGDEWISEDNKCVSYKCVAGKHEVEKVEQVYTCNKTCPAYAKYVEPSKESLDCCGYCEVFGCEENGVVYKIDDEWIPFNKPCYTAQCTKHIDEIQIIYIGKQCPLMPDTCAEEDITLDDSGCCKICQNIPGDCMAKVIPLEETIQLFYLNDKERGSCFNYDPIENLKQCAGHCPSNTMYSTSTGSFRTNCKCCTPKQSEVQYVILECEDGTKLTKEYSQPINCECTVCSEENSSNTIILPTPKK